MTTYAELTALFEATLAGRSWKPPIHVVRRLVQLIGDDEIVFLDGAAAPTKTAGLIGQIVAMSPTRVIVAEMDNALDIEDGAKLSGSSSATVSTWARKTLQGISFDADPLGTDNLDYAWVGEVSAALPATARVTLRYQHRQLGLPSGASPRPTQLAAMHALLPSLIADVIAS